MFRRDLAGVPLNLKANKSFKAINLVSWGIPFPFIYADFGGELLLNPSARGQEIINALRNDALTTERQRILTTLAGSSRPCRATCKGLG